MPFIHVGACSYPVFITHRWHNSKESLTMARESKNGRKCNFFLKEVCSVIEIYLLKEACLVLCQTWMYMSGSGFSCSFQISLYWNRVNTSIAEMRSPLNSEATPAYLQVSWQCNTSNVQYYLNLSKKPCTPKQQQRRLAACWCSCSLSITLGSFGSLNFLRDLATLD